MPPLTFAHGHALLIGVGADLPVTVEDARALGRILTDPARAAYPEAQVETLTEAGATRAGILEGFDRLIERVGKDAEATAVVYFSGHGGFLGTPSEYLLVPYGFDNSKYEQTSVSAAEFTAKIEAIKARKLVVFLDCCHGGGVPQFKGPGAPIEKSPMPPDLLDKLKEGSGRVVVASSRPNEFSYIKAGAKNSLFTECLIEALSGKAGGRQDGFARILEVLSYLLEKVPERAKPDDQHPMINDVRNLGENFPLCYYAGGSKALPGAPAAVGAGDWITLAQLERQQMKLADLRSAFTLWSEKIKSVREDLAIAPAGDTRFQIQYQLSRSEAERSSIESRIEVIEAQIRELEAKLKLK